ncbi:MAG: VOC family protein [Bacillus sp. (in: Bacteria)]|nr:VOC family protein [Bacillus sp. (in: firmicutes)]
MFDLLPSGYEDYRPSKKINKASPFQLTNNIAVQVKNYEDALAFYKNVLGFSLVEKNDDEAKLSINGVNFYIENAPEGTMNTFFEFAVDDVEGVKSLLLNEGCIITKEYSSKSFMVKDPYGLNFHIFESN